MLGSKWIWLVLSYFFVDFSLLKTQFTARQVGGLRLNITMRLLLRLSVKSVIQGAFSLKFCKNTLAKKTKNNKRCEQAFECIKASSDHSNLLRRLHAARSCIICPFPTYSSAGLNELLSINLPRLHGARISSWMWEYLLAGDLLAALMVVWRGTHWCYFSAFVSYVR